MYTHVHIPTHTSTHTHTRKLAQDIKIGQPHLERKHFASFKRTDYPTVFQRQDRAAITFAGSSRIFHREVGGSSPTAARERPEGVATGCARFTVVLPALALVVVCATFRGQRDLSVLGAVTRALCLRLRAAYGRGLWGKPNTINNNKDGQFRGVPDTGVRWGPESGRRQGLFWKEDSGPGRGGGCWAEQLTSEQPGGEQAPNPWARAEGPQQQASPPAFYLSH